MAARGKVLVVDDEPDAKELYARLLGGARFDLATAGTLDEARKRLDSEPFDVVVLDLGLPDGYGGDLLAAVRIACPDIPVIIVTGTPSPQTVADTSVRGALAYLEKPLDAEELKRHLALAIWGPSA